MFDAGDLLELVFYVGGSVLEIASAVPGTAAVPPAPASIVAPARDFASTRLEAHVMNRHSRDAERLACLSELLTRTDHDPSFALQLLLADPSAVIRTRAIEALGKRRTQGAFASLSRMRGQTDEESAAIATALARIGGVAAEKRLLALLVSGPPVAQLAAAKALRHVGTLAAVAPLREQASAWFSGELATEASAAIAGIQRRHSRAAAGALSIGGVRGGGELSPPVDVGAVSLRMKESDE